MRQRSAVLHLRVEYQIELIPRLDFLGHWDRKVGLRVNVSGLLGHFEVSDRDDDFFLFLPRLLRAATLHLIDIHADQLRKILDELFPKCARRFQLPPNVDEQQFIGPFAEDFEQFLVDELFDRRCTPDLDCYSLTFTREHFDVHTDCVDIHLLQIDEVNDCLFFEWDFAVAFLQDFSVEDEMDWVYLQTLGLRCWFVELVCGYQSRNVDDLTVLQRVSDVYFEGLCHQIKAI